jgi:hypothetical protein
VTVQKLSELLKEVKDDVLKDRWANGQTLQGVFSSLDIESVLTVVEDKYGEHEPCIAIPLKEYDKLLKALTQ